MIKTKTLLLAAILATLAQAQVRKAPWPPTPYEFTVSTDERDVAVAEEIRDDATHGKVLVRKLAVRYHVPTTDLAEDRYTAMLLGAEDGPKIDTLIFFGVSMEKELVMRYVKIEFFEHERLVATKDLGRDDPYNVKALRIYERARKLYEQKKEPGIR